MVRSTFLFSHWNRESKTDDPAIVNSLAFNSETKVSSDSLFSRYHSYSSQLQCGFTADKRQAWTNCENNGN